MRVFLTGSNILPNSSLLEQYNIKLELVSELNNSNSYMMTIPDTFKIINASECIDAIHGCFLLNENEEPIINMNLSSYDPNRNPDANYDYMSSGNVIVYPIKLPNINQIRLLKQNDEESYWQLIGLMKKSYNLNVIDETVENQNDENMNEFSNNEIQYNNINLNYIPEDFNNNKKI